MANNARQSRYRLANQILDVAREARFEPGHHLREQQLGDLLGVSRTPIRSALTLLAERGAVEAIKNQGFFLKAPPEELHRLEVEIPSTADQDLYTRIVEDRLLASSTKRSHRLKSAAAMVSTGFSCSVQLRIWSTTG